ncbi:hypothetical protein GBA52_021138 [Prunus armeniaca]|nr:hypothetical protein GBA52_021138 [Prunus armeniaca]
MRNKEEEIPGDEKDKPDQKKKEEEDRQIRRGRKLRRGRGFAVWGVLAWSNMKINNRAKLFNGYFLALAKATGITNPKHIPILKQDFWVQVKGLPFGYITRTVGKIIDDALGGYMSLVLRLNGEPIEIDVRLTGRQFGFPSSSGWSRPALKEDASSSAMVEDSGSTKSSMPNQLATNALQNLEGFQTEEALALTQPFPRPSPKISRPK